MSSYFAFFIFISSQRKFWNTILASWIVTELINSHSISNFPSRPTRPPLCLFCHWPPPPPPFWVKHMKQKNTTTLKTTANTTAHHVRQHRPPMPPTKAMGAITQNRRGHPTATPWSTSWSSGALRFRRARERRHRLLGCIFWAKFGRRGGLIPWPNRDGRTELDRLSQSKNSTIPQSTVGGLLLFGESARGRNGGPVCGGIFDA